MMKKSIAVLMLMASLQAQAAHNFWHSGFGMGDTEYTLTSPDNVEFRLTCTSNPDEQGVLQHNVTLTLPGGQEVSSRDEATRISIVTEGHSYPLPAFLGWRNGDNEWSLFISTIRQAGEFDVYVNDKKVAHFHPKSGNTRQVLKDLAACSVS